MGFWTFVLAICVVSIAGGIINNWIKARHGYPIEDAGTQTQSGKRTMEAICAENQDLKKRLAEVTDRLAVLERIATDQPSALTREIENLR